MSIGYRTLESEKRKEDGARRLKRIRLYEFSFVSRLPMNLKAGVETIKNLTYAQIGDELEQLREQGKVKHVRRFPVLEDQLCAMTGLCICGHYPLRTNFI
jgi:hypothetical protein